MMNKIRYPGRVLLITGLFLLSCLLFQPRASSNLTTTQQATAVQTGTKAAFSKPSTIPATATIPMPSKQATLGNTLTVAPLVEATTTPEPVSSSTAGDPYAPELGNSGYDVQKYTLQLALDPATPVISATANLDAVSTAQALEQISLDFVGFQIDSITSAGIPLQFQRQGNKLLIDLPQTLSPGMPFTLTIRYNGAPVKETSQYVPFLDHLGLQYQPNSIYVIAEPDGARYWFPANDHPRDKAKFRFELSVPSGLVGVANGKLVETRTGGSPDFPGNRPRDLYVWEENAPMATYLATVAVGNYELIEGSSSSGVQLRNYVFPEDRGGFVPLVPKIGEMLDWMSNYLGAYPFETFGYVIVKSLGASIESQTLVILDENSIDEETMVHELAHMWFGDWVSLNSWGEVWRNEGFATYFSLLWATRDNPLLLEQRIADFERGISGQPAQVPLLNPPVENMFGVNSYVKGAIAVHALRKEMGDKAFFEGLRSYFQIYGGGTASEAEFQAVMEEAAGKSLESFFQKWMY